MWARFVPLQYLYVPEEAYRRESLGCLIEFVRAVRATFVRDVMPGAERLEDVP